MRFDKYVCAVCSDSKVQVIYLCLLWNLAKATKGVDEYYHHSKVNQDALTPAFFMESWTPLLQILCFVDILEYQMARTSHMFAL